MKTVQRQIPRAIINVTEKNSTDLFYELRKIESQRQSQKWKKIRQNPRSRHEQQV